MKKKSESLLHITIICISIFALSQKLFAQTQQRYNGAYTLRDSIQGTANYTYHTLNDSIEMNGLFRFSSDVYRMKQEDKIARLIINGNFEKNKKSGRWQYDLGEYSVNYKDIQDLRLISSLNGHERRIICRYNLGFPEGEWEIFRNSIVNGRRQGQAISSKANFKDGIITGPFSFDDRDGDNFISITGNFNSEGFFHKEWTFSYSYEGKIYKEYREYLQGFLVKLIIQDAVSNSTLYSIHTRPGRFKIEQKKWSWLR